MLGRRLTLATRRLLALVTLAALGVALGPAKLQVTAECLSPLLLASPLLHVSSNLPALVSESGTEAVGDGTRADAAGDQKCFCGAVDRERRVGLSPHALVMTLLQHTLNS